MTILNLTTKTSTLPTGVKNIKLETFAAGPKGAYVTTYLTNTPLNYRMTTEDATFVLADEKIQSIAGAGGKGLKGGYAGQPASLPVVVSEKSFAYVNDTSEEVHTDILYEENNSIFFLAENGSLVMPFGYRIDPSTPDAVWPYLGFTTTRVLVEADQAIGPGPITLTTSNNTVTWDTSSKRLPTGTYTLEDLLDRITSIFQTAGDRGFRAAHGSGGKIRLNTLYTVRFTNPTGSIWSILGFTKLTLIPPGPPVNRGQAIPIKLINDGLTATTFPTEVDTLWYTAPEDADGAAKVELELLSRSILPDTTTNLVVGKKYKIATLGTDDWNLFGTSFGPTVLSSNLVAHSSIIYEVLPGDALTPLEWYSIGGAINANDDLTSLLLDAFYIIKTLGTYSTDDWETAGWTGPGTTPSIGDSFKCIAGVTLTGDATCNTITVPPVGYYFRANGSTPGARLKEVSEFTCTADTILATGSCYEIDGIYSYNYNQTKSEWTPGKKIRSSFAFPDIGTMSDVYDTASPFLFSTSGSLFFRSIPNKLNVTTSGGEPLMLKSGVTPFFTVETWVKFANDPQATDEKIIYNDTCTFYREATTGNLGFKIIDQKWVGTTRLKKDIWYHVAVVAKSRNPIRGPLTTLGVQAGMVCSGPGIKGYALVNAGLTLTPAPESTIGIDFLFESSGVTLFLDGLTEVLTLDAGVVNWTALDLTDDTPVNIGIQKPLLGSLTPMKTFTGTTTIKDVAANEAYFFLLTTEGINVLTTAGASVSSVELVDGKKIVTSDMWVYVATTNKIYGYTIDLLGILNPLLGSTDIGTTVLNMAISQGYIYVVTSGVLQTLKIELDGSLTALPAKTIAAIATIALNPAGTYAYVTTTTTLLEYTITDGILSTTPITETLTAVIDLVLTDTEIYITTTAGLSVYKTGSLETAPKTQALTGAEQIAVDPTGRIYVRGNVDNNIYIYRLTAAGNFEAGLPVALTLTDDAFFYADATAVWTTSAQNFNKSLQQAETGGYVSNVRITGEPVYQENFYPSVRPLSVLSRTTLLLLCEAEEPLKNSASLSFISFYDNFTVTPATNPLNVPDYITLAKAGSYILSCDYTNDTTGNMLHILNKSFDLDLTTEGKFNQAVYLDTTTTFKKDSGTVTLTNIRLKRIRTTDLGKGGAGTPVGGQGYLGGASGGSLQPLGSAGGSSFPGADALNSAYFEGGGKPQGATVTYLNGITPIPPEIDATELIPSNYYRITDLGTLLPTAWQAIGADADASVDEFFQCVTASNVQGGKCILVNNTNEIITEQYTTFLAETWIAPTVAMNNDMVTYGQNVFLTGKRGTGDLMLFDGTDWTPATSPSGILWQGLTYSPEVNLFLGVTNTGDIWTNTAIKTADWQFKYAARRSADITRKVFILYGPTGFVIIDNSSRVVFRSNKTGTRWTQVADALPAGVSYNSLAGSTGEIVAVGNSTVVSSKDGGLTWQAGTITVAGGDGIVGVVYGHQGFKIITEAGNVFRRQPAAWVADADTIGITDITAVGYGGGKYIALNADGDYALGNAWTVSSPNQDFAPNAVVFGQGIFLTATGYQLGEYDTAQYTATINTETTKIEITRSTTDGLKTVTPVSIEEGLEFLVINDSQYIPLTGDGLNLNGKPMLTSGTFPFSNTVYRKVQVELVGASGGGSAQNAGGHAARVILRGARLSENIDIRIGVAGTGTGPKYPGGGATALYLYTLEGDVKKSTGFLVAGGGGGAGANGNGGNAAENTGQKGQDGSGSPGSGGSDEEPGLPDGQPKIQIGEAPRDLPGQTGGGGGGITGGGNGVNTSGGGGGGGGSGTEGLTYMAVSYETAGLPGNGSVQIVTLPELKDDPDRDDATILYLIQPPLPSHYAYSRTISYVVNIDAQSNVQITARTAELETVTEFVGDAQQYDTVVIIDSETKNTSIFGKTPPICFHTGTGILTPTGYVPVERLKEGDLVLTACGETVPIVKQVSFQTSSTECPLYCLPAGGLATGVPLKDLYLSHNHAYKVDGHWRHMKCSTAAYEIVKPIITYHHLYLPDYFRYTLIAEGVEVESAFEETRYLRMGWLCEENECVPLKCEKVKF